VYLAPADLIDGGFRYPLRLSTGASIVLEITASHGGIVISADRRMAGKEKRALQLLAEHMLSLDFPLTEFIAVCRARKVTALLRLARRGWGRMFRSPSVWEDAVKTLCTTNASWGYTEKMCRNLCAQLGEPTPSGLKTFPGPDAILKAGQRFLKNSVGMGYRAKSLVMLARKAAAGKVPWLLDCTERPDAAAAEKEIRSWHGFGSYATKHLLVLMGFHDYLPIDREVGNHLGIRKPGDKGSDLNSDHFEDWGKFRFTAYKLTRVARRVNWIGD
jgi:N-glycosylase/DNA lyase